MKESSEDDSQPILEDPCTLDKARAEREMQERYFCPVCGFETNFKGGHSGCIEEEIA